MTTKSNEICRSRDHWMALIGELSICTGTPLLRMVNLSTTTNHAAFLIDGVEVMAPNWDVFGLGRCGKNLRTRWVDATIDPLGMVQ